MRRNIQCIENADGEEKSNFEDIVKVVRYYYTQTFTKEGGGEISTVMDVVECKVTREMNKILSKTFTLEEIQEAIKHMHPRQSPWTRRYDSTLFSNFLVYL